MSKRLIYAEDALDLIDQNRAYMSDVGRIHARNAVNEAPTVDAAEVVRCKDCKNRLEGTKMCSHPGAMGWDAIEVEDDDFCSYGERRADNERKAD